MYGFNSSSNVHSALVSVAGENFLRWRSSHSFATAANVSAYRDLLRLALNAWIATCRDVLPRFVTSLTRILQ